MINPTISSIGNFTANVALQAGANLVAQSARRGFIIPSISACIFSVIQSVVSNTVIEGIKFIEKTVFGLDETDLKTVALANYIIGQVISIFLTALIVNNLALVLFDAALMYDMNPPSLSLYDRGSIFCIVAQSSLVTLFVKSVIDFAQMINERLGITQKVKALFTCQCCRAEEKPAPVKIDGPLYADVD
jgi:hypothetical protein